MSKIVHAQNRGIAAREIERGTRCFALARSRVFFVCGQYLVGRNNTTGYSMCHMPKGRGAVSTGLPTPLSCPRTLSTLHPDRRIDPAHSIVLLTIFAFSLSPVASFVEQDEPSWTSQIFLDGFCTAVNFRPFSAVLQCDYWRIDGTLQLSDRLQWIVRGAHVQSSYPQPSVQCLRMIRPFISHSQRHLITHTCS
ncbi:hypothetical protein BJX62DRAFT_76992 [Aspergillus germanicus]